MDDVNPLSSTLEDAHKLLLYAKDVLLLANTYKDAQELIPVSRKTISCIISRLLVALKHSHFPVRYNIGEGCGVHD